MPEKANLRRRPKQSRGQQRVNTILDAAEQIFSEVGFKAATTNAIARRADTNIASLYQYFQNKEAILEAVVKRYRAEYDALADAIFSPENDCFSLSELAEHMSIATVDLHIRHGVVRPFFVGVGETASEFGPIEMEVYGGVLQRANRAMALRMPELSEEQRLLTLKVIMRVMQAVIALADIPGGANKQAVINAVKTMVHAYLDSLASDTDHDQITQENRQFLKAHLWRAWFNSQPDQKKGIPAPPLEKPLPTGAVLIYLPDPLASGIGKISLAQAIRQRRSWRKYSDAPLNLDELSFLLWATQGLGVDESGQPLQRGVSVLRNVPSGGARHSFETYLLLRKITGLESGLYRYLPLSHRLARLHTLAEIAPRLQGKEAATGWITEAAALFMWTSLPYRSEWRYSIVAARLIALDAGHVCQNLYLACEAIDAGMCAIGAYNQQEMDELLEVDGEDEFTVYCATVGKKG